MPKQWVVGETWAVLMAVGLLSCGRHAAAEQPTRPGKILISEVIISGNHRTSTEEIKAHLHTKPNKEYNPAIVDDDVRELYKTGQYSNIATFLQPDGQDRGKICFAVREMPNMVQKVTFLGAKHIKPDELYSITGVWPSKPLNPTLNRQGCQRILEKYAEQGRSFAECQLMKGGDTNDTEVVYQITEGPKVKVLDIQIAGNSAAIAARLRKKIPVQVGGTYNQKTAEAGIDELYAFYRDLGYQDARISLEARHDPAAGKVTLIYHIHEGERSQPHSSKSKP